VSCSGSHLCLGYVINIEVQKPAECCELLTEALPSFQKSVNNRLKSAFV
jgi:hypothetical protein